MEKQNAEDSRVQPGDRFLKPSTVWDRLDHGKTWLWLKVKQGAENGLFPQPIYLEGHPYFIERELDAYIARSATSARNKTSGNAERLLRARAEKMAA